MATESRPRLIDGCYRIERLLAEGGMGEVCLARDERADRAVVLKLLRPMGGARRDREARRLRREARALAGLDHPSIVRCLDHGSITESGAEVPYLVLEHLEGPTLASIGAENVSPRWALECVMKLASAVDHAHERGLVHRDLKPANVVIVPPGRPVLLDFGLVKDLQTPSLTASSTTRPVGSVEFMAPEHLVGHPPNRAADVYGLGGILLWLLTGRAPNPIEVGPRGELPFSRMLQAVNAPPPDFTVCAHLDPIVGKIWRKALARRPERRFARPREMGEAIARYLALHEAAPVHRLVTAGGAAGGSVLPCAVPRAAFGLSANGGGYRVEADDGALWPGGYGVVSGPLRHLDQVIEGTTRYVYRRDPC